MLSCNTLVWHKCVGIASAVIVCLLTLARCSFRTARGGACGAPGRPRALSAVPAKRFARTLMAGARSALLQHRRGGLATTGMQNWI